jgi:hypothetical protein
MGLLREQKNLLEQHDFDDEFRIQAKMNENILSYVFYI